jgi:hypothetical protein
MWLRGCASKPRTARSWSSRVAAAEGFVEVQEVPSLTLKGLSRPVRAFNIHRLK